MGTLHSYRGAALRQETNDHAVLERGHTLPAGCALSMSGREANHDGLPEQRRGRNRIETMLLTANIRQQANPADVEAINTE